MSHPLAAPLQSPAWVAGSTQEIRTDRLISTLDGMPNHIVALQVELWASITDGGETAEPGAEIANAIAHLRIRDVLGNEILRLRGRHLRTLMKACTGWRFDDPEPVPGQGGGQIPRYAMFEIPFHGRGGGLLGSRAYDDFWLPVDRLRGVPIEVEWSAADVFDNAGDITDAILRITPVYKPYKSVVVGADVRWHYSDYAANASVHWPLRGKALHTAIMMVADRCVPWGDWHDFTIDEFSYLNRATLPQLVGAWDARCALDVAQHEEIVDRASYEPEFIPIVFQDRRDALTGLMMFPLGRMELQVTTDETDTFELLMCEVHDTQDLARKLMGRPQTVFQGANIAVPKYSEKNQPGRHGKGVNPLVASRLNHLLAHQLRRV